MAQRRICVFGAGAIGGHLAAKLAAAGHAVSVVARGAHLEAIRANGIALREGARSYREKLRASADAAELGTQDIVLVTTKATGLPALADAARKLAGAETLFVFVQNGIPWWYAHGLAPSRPRPPELARLDPGGALARAVPPRNAIGAVVYSSNQVTEPGVVVNHSDDRNMLVVGEIDDADSTRIGELRALLTGAGMSSPPTGDIRRSVWDKLLLNFGSLACVPLGEPVNTMLLDPALRAVRDRALAEGRAIATAHGVALEGAPRRPGGGHSAGPTGHKPSILQDYELGRPMEVEALLAVPCAFARAAKVAAPTLELLHALIARLAARKGLYSPPAA